MEQAVPEGEIQTREVLLESPEYLEPGQNFFNQEPFINVSDKLVVDGIDPKAFHNALVRRARAWNRHTTEQEWINEPEFDETMLPSRRRQILISKIMSAGEKKANAIRIAEEVIEIERFPQVLEYIESKKTGTLYKYSGEAIPETTEETFKLEKPKSYAAWLASQQDSANREISHGISEVFPDEPPITVGLRIPAAKPETRKWRILKHAELVRPVR